MGELTVEMVDELLAREDHEDGSERYYQLLQTVTSLALIRAALVERNEARAHARQMQADIEAEQMGRLAFRRRFGARDHETMGAFLERLATERDEATQALETAQARIDELTARAEKGEGVRAAEKAPEPTAQPAEPSTAEEYETLTGAPETYEALLNGVDAIDARRKS